MRRAALLAAVAALTLPPAASAQHHGGQSGRMPHVSIGFSDFDPPQLDILAGESAHWSNESVRTHDVTAEDRSWASGDLFARQAFMRGFGSPGSFAYYCARHPFMRGAVGVHELLLDPPLEPGAPGRPFTLRGRSALAAGTPVTIEASSGGGFAALATTETADDGTFTATVRPRGSGELRAVAGAAASPRVNLLVLDRRVRASARTWRNGRATVRARVSPASAGATVVLQVRLRERFGWWPVRRTELDRRSRARFRVKPRGAVRARVALTLADGATVLAAGPRLEIGRG